MIYSILRSRACRHLTTADPIYPEFLQWIKDFPRDVVPEIEHHLRDFEKTIVRFHSRTEVDNFIESL